MKKNSDEPLQRSYVFLLLLNSFTTWNYTGNPINVLCLIICSGKQQQNKSLLNSRLLYICVTLLRLNPASRWIFISAFISKQIFWLRVKDTGFTVYLYFHCKNLDNSIGGHLNWSIGLLVTSSISVDKRSHNKKQALQELITIPSASKLLVFHVIRSFYLSICLDVTYKFRNTLLGNWYIIMN